MEDAMIRGAWQAWLDYLKRLRERDAAARKLREVINEERRKLRDYHSDNWHAPTEDESNADMKGWKGQGVIEYAMILGLLAVVIIAILVLLGPTIGNLFSPPVPPRMGAPLLQIVRYCEPLARDAHSRYDITLKQTITTYTDNPTLFVDCMQRYEWQVTR
jgi:pilus assembly protein Flp/PilA